MAAADNNQHIDDKAAKTVGTEISTAKNADRLTAWNTLSHVKPEEMKAAVAAIDANIDKKSLGLTDFHLDDKTPFTKIPISAEQSPNGKAFDIPAFVFTNSAGKTVQLLPSGSEYDVTDPNKIALIRTADAKDLPPAAAPPEAPPVAPPAAPPEAPPAAPPEAPPAAPPAETDPDRAKVLQMAQAGVDAASKVQAKEGYFQVLQRLNPDWDGHKLSTEAHKLKAANGNSSLLKVGQDIGLSAEDKAGALAQVMANYDKASPEEKAKILAQAKAQFPDAPPAAPPAAPPEAPPVAPPEAPPAAPPAAPPEAPPAAPPAAPPEAPPAAPPAAPPEAPPVAPPEAPPVAPPEAPPPVPPAVPTLDITSAKLNPTIINASGDKNSADNYAYNPIAPRGLTENGEGANVTTEVQQLAQRTTTAGKDANSTHTEGYFNNWTAFHWGDTGVKSDDTYADGKLKTRVTTYDNGQLNMNFQTTDPAHPVQVNGVRKVETAYDPASRGYNTKVTDDNGKVYSFVNDENGSVMGYTPPPAPVRRGRGR